MCRQRSWLAGCSGGLGPACKGALKGASRGGLKQPPKGEAVAALGAGVRQERRLAAGPEPARQVAWPQCLQVQASSRAASWASMTRKLGRWVWSGCRHDSTSSCASWDSGENTGAMGASNSGDNDDARMQLVESNTYSRLLPKATDRQLTRSAGGQPAGTCSLCCSVVIAYRIWAACRPAHARSPDSICSGQSATNAKRFVGTRARALGQGGSYMACKPA